MSLRILLATDLYPPVIGGLEAHVQGLARELARRGHRVAVATQPADGCPAHEHVDGVDVHRIDGWSRVLARTYQDARYRFLPPAPDPGMVRALRRLIARERPDVVHVHGWMLYSAAAALLGRRRPALVCTLHDYGLVCARKTLTRAGRRCPGPGLRECLRSAPEQYGAAKGTALVAALAGSAPLHRRVDRFLAVSSSVRDASRPRLAGRPIEVVPNFLSTEVPEATAPRPGFLPDDDGFVLYVGALAAHKGVDVLLAAQPAFADLAPLVLVGPPAGLEPASGPGLTVVPGAPRAEVMAAWPRAGVAVVPSVWDEPCPTVAIEAMASGIPVVASRVGGLPDIVADGRSGLLVPPGDPAALGAAIARLLADAGLRRRMGEAARADAERFGARAVVDRVEAVYAEEAAA